MSDVRSSVSRERHDVDATGLQDRAVSQIDAVQRQILEPLCDGVALARQETCPHPVGHLSKPQVEAGRLDLVRIDGTSQLDPLALDQRFDGMSGKNTLSRGFRRCNVDGFVHWAFPLKTG